MPRPKFRSQHGGRKDQKNYKRGKGKASFGNNASRKRKQLEPIDGAKRKYKFIRRNQESEEALRRQKQLEKEFDERNNAAKESEFGNNDLESSSEEEIDPMQQLLSTLAAGGQKVYSKTNEAIESSESESDIEAEGRDSGDDIFPEKFENQSLPRGKKYRSSDEDSANNDNTSEDSEDDLPEDTDLRPEESTDRPMLDDSIELDEVEESEESEAESIDAEGDTDNDIFSMHLEYELSPQLLECVSTTHHSKRVIFNWPTMGRIQVEIPTTEEQEQTAANKNKTKKKLTLLGDDTEYAREGSAPTLYDVNAIDLEKLNVKVQMQSNIIAANKSNLPEDCAMLSNLQTELFSIMNNYQDLFYSQRTHANGEEIRFVYCMHALNHILKTRAKILNHNLKLKLMTASDSKSAAIIPDKYRDQGLFRTKVLIVVPFRESALRIVNLFIALLFPSGGSAGSKQVMHYKRFLDEFGGESLHFPKKKPKPEDYEQTFAGNSDDTFRIGLTFTRKCLKLYSDFYSSDILIVSPLGLRMIVGAPGDKERDYDFLASIEMLILDQAEIFLAQNWDHLLHVLDHLHLQPQSARNTDFSRVRPWCLNGWTRFYRQTLLFASHELPEFRSLFNTRCSNYRGKVRLANPIENGAIKHVAVQIPQVFHHIDVTSIQSSFDQRFDHFVNHILPQYKSASHAHCLVFVPSYFDFVRIRNYFKKETINFVQICEYTKVSGVDYVSFQKEILVIKKTLCFPGCQDRSGPVDVFPQRCSFHVVFRTCTLLPSHATERHSPFDHVPTADVAQFLFGNDQFDAGSKPKST